MSISMVRTYVPTYKKNHFFLCSWYNHLIFTCQKVWRTKSSLFFFWWKKVSQKNEPVCSCPRKAHHCSLTTSSTFISATSSEFVNSPIHGSRWLSTSYIRSTKSFLAGGLLKRAVDPFSENLQKKTRLLESNTRKLSTKNCQQKIVTQKCHQP